MRSIRKRTLEQDRNRATRLQAVHDYIPEACAPDAGIGIGHRAFAVGQILFCKICGATKSRSGGSRLARPCRGWAPRGTLATIRARLQGRNCGFYRDTFQRSSVVTPVGNLAPPTPPLTRQKATTRASPASTYQLTPDTTTYVDTTLSRPPMGIARSRPWRRPIPPPGHSASPHVHVKVTVPDNERPSEDSSTNAKRVRLRGKHNASLGMSVGGSDD